MYVCLSDIADLYLIFITDVTPMSVDRNFSGYDQLFVVFRYLRGHTTFFFQMVRKKKQKLHVEIFIAKDTELFQLLLSIKTTEIARDFSLRGISFCISLSYKSIIWE